MKEQIPYFTQSWRWFGPQDSISLQSIRQTGATGIVTALHHIPNGQVWKLDEIQSRKEQIESARLTWRVVESVPVHEDIKRRSGNYLTYIENYKQSLRNLADAGIRTVCYNFMPVLDWTRTNLDYSLADGASALRFEKLALVAFDVCILNRENHGYSAEEVDSAKQYFARLNSEDKDQLTRTILAGLPGAEEGYGIPEFREILKSYQEVDDQVLRENLYSFLQEIIPVAEESGVQMAIHPDDPPFPLFGLPRVVSTASDYKQLIHAPDSPMNGITFCTGSLGVRPDNDLVKMIHDLGDRIHFVHLRTTRRDADGNFYEAPHLSGDVDMPAVMSALIDEQYRRVEQGRTDLDMPFRPDHGHVLLDDAGKSNNPGYSLIGRMRGLAELRGLELGLRSGKQ